MKKTSTLLILIFTSLVMFANNPSKNHTQTVRGVVVDKYNKLPLPGANVILLGSDPLIGVSTDINGKFRLENVQIGRIDIAIKYLGYNDVVLKNLELTTGKELVLNIEMEERIIQGQEVKIIAKVDKTKSQNKLATVSARGFTIEESQRYAGSMNDVARMASNYAGVLSADDSRNDIIIRGNSPTGLLWRLEGIDIPSPNHYSTFGATGGPVCILNNNVLANSDFMTAAFPAEYGNALSGVFDLKMRNGNNEKHEFLGQIGFNGCELGAEGPISKANGSSYLINARYSTLEVMADMGMDFGTGTAIPKYSDLTFKFNFPETKFGRISIFGLGGQSEIEFKDSKRDTVEDASDDNLYTGDLSDLKNGSEMVTIGVNHTYLFNNSTYGKLAVAYTYQYSHTDIDSLAKLGATPFPYLRQNFKESKIVTHYFLSKKFTKQHELKVGGIFNQRDFNLMDSIYDKPLGHFVNMRDSKGSVQSLQPYVNWRYKISDHLIMNTGVHYLHFLYNDSYSIEPRWGLRWNFAPTHSISFGYGRHSQIAPITTYFYEVYMKNSNSYIQPNTELEMTHAHHFVMGHDWSINEYTRVKSELYYQTLSNAPIDAEEDNAYSMLNEGAGFYVYSPDYLKNGGKGENYGIELTLERFLHKGLYFLATGSLFESKYEGSDGKVHNTAFNGNYVANALIGKEFFLNQDGKHPYSLNIDIKTTRAGGRRYTPAYAEFDQESQRYTLEYEDDKAFSKRYPDYFRTDLRVGIKLNSKKITQEWALDINNIFDYDNPFQQIVNRRTGEVSYSSQMGILIIPQYRITF